MHLWCAGGRKWFQLCSSTHLCTKILPHLCINFCSFVLLPVLCLILRCQEALFIYRTWRIEQMVLVFQPFSPVLVLFSWILVMRLLHCVVLECLWNSWCTTEKYRLESALLYKGDLNPPTSIVPVTVLVNVCHNDLIPMERENKLLILIILCCCFLFILVKLVLSS